MVIEIQSRHHTEILRPDTRGRKPISERPFAVPPRAKEIDQRTDNQNDSCVANLAQEVLT